MARILIVGCGCRGRRLARALGDRGHAVRGTSRSGEGREAIEAAGVEGVVADPDRLGTLLPHLEGASVLCWLMGTAAGEPAKVAELHGVRLEALLETLVDTHVRGVVYEAAGTVAPTALAAGTELVRRLADLYRMPVELLTESPGDSERWLEAGVRGVDAVLAA
jgi:nucleoside-diphosphate-sugar epimerase